MHSASALSPALPITPPAAGFEVTDWSVVDDSGYATLHIDFTAKYDGWLSLKNPNGTTTAHEQFSKEDTSAKLHMTDKQEEVPKKGAYKLVVKDTSGITKTTKTLYFEGAKVWVSGLSEEWSLPKGSDLWTLQLDAITIENIGDVPLYVCRCKVSVAPESKSQDIHPHKVVLPGETKNISIKADITGLEEGVKTVTIKLYDGADNLLSTYS